MSQGIGALGRLGYSIVETVTNTVVGQGVMGVEEASIEVDEHRSSDNVLYYRKRIRLTGPFGFALDEHPGKNESEMTGFALTATHADVPITSWEWFEVKESRLATKLQEGGQLKIEIAQASHGYEVVRTEFLTDVSLRLTRHFGNPMEEPYWRMTICKGSWIAWPPVD